MATNAPENELAQLEQLRLRGDAVVAKGVGIFRERLRAMLSSDAEQETRKADLDERRIAELIETERTLLRAEFVKEFAGGNFSQVAELQGVLSRLPATTYVMPSIELAVNSKRVAVAAALGALGGAVVAMLFGFGSEQLAFGLILGLAPVGAGLVVLFSCLELSAGMTSKLVGGGVLVVAAGAARWVLARGWFGRLGGVVRGGGMLRWFALGGIATLFYAVRVWVRAGRYSQSSVFQWLEQISQQFQAAAQADQCAIAAWLARKTDARRAPADGPVDLLVEVFDQYRKNKAPQAREVLEELFAMSNLLPPEDGQAKLIYNDELQKRVQSGEIELVGNVQPGDALVWVRLPVLQAQPGNPRHVCRKGRVEKPG